MIKRISQICVSVIITILLLLLSIYCFPKSWLRLFESFGDFGQSIAYYFYRVFLWKFYPKPSIVNYSNVFEISRYLPDSKIKFEAFFTEFFRLFVDKEHFSLWAESLEDKLMVLADISTLILPLTLLFIAISSIVKAQSNNKHNVDTLSLRLYKKFMKVIGGPVYRYVRDYVLFFKENFWIFKIWCLIIIIMLNLGSIIVSAVGYLFYFCVYFELDNTWVQLSKLIIDLQVIFKTIPVWLWVVMAYVLLCFIRQKIAIGRLRHMEAQNCGFINSLPIVSMTNGTMGKKKTTMITDMALSQEVMFRQKALDILQSNDFKFPYFPWICFEMEIRKCMEFGTIYNLASVKDFIEKKKLRFSKHGDTNLQLYGYNLKEYGLIYNNWLYDSNVFDVLETYAKAYFIYVITSSLIIANYSIREDNEMMDEGNFPLWVMDFFPKRFRENDRHSHILDFDILRLGRKVIENNPNAGSFEFGIIAITEIGKERGNNLELKDVKKTDKETNQKNDLFNNWLKMCRHSATVDNFPFIKVFCDEQRPESWGADARDLCDIVRIDDSGTQKLAMPFYAIEEMIIEMIVNRFSSEYYDFRYRRGDNTLLMYLYKKLATWLFNRNLRFYNKYGYSALKVVKESGTQDGKKKEKRYYIINMKMYRRRFITNCFGDYFNELARGSVVGIMDYIEYETEKANVEELKMQNSYFINSLYKDSNANQGG